MYELQLRHVPEYHHDGQELHRQVRTVDVARDIDQRNALLGALLLEPKAVDVNVPEFGDALPVEDALGGGRVDLEPDADVRAHGVAEGLFAKALACSPDIVNSIEFRFG